MPYFYFGSSPRVRGTLYNYETGRYDKRFIPACAGNVNKAVSFVRRVSVHPRVCGEHLNAR